MSDELANLDETPPVKPEDLPAGPWSRMHADARTWFMWVYTHKVYPRLVKTVTEIRKTGEKQTELTVDGWPVSRWTEAADMLNRPPRKPPPPPMTAEELLEHECAKAMQDPDLLNPKAVAAEMKEENDHRPKVFADRIRSGLSAARYGRRLAITRKLEALARAGKDPTDLFG